MGTIFEESSDKELASGYFKIAEELVEKVESINPAAVVIKNWKDKDERGLVIGLIESYHRNIGDDFWLNPFNYLNPENFK